MKKLLLACVLFSGAAFGQETQFAISENGLTDFIVTAKDGKTASEMYKKTLEWVNKTYKNPDKVILSTVENDYIRVEGVSQNMVCLQMLTKTCYDTKYQIEYSFKDGKYKTDVISLDYLIPATQYTRLRWANFTTSPKSTFYKSDGSFRAMYKYYPEVPAYLNALNKNLSDYIDGTGEAAKKNDW